MQCKSKDIVKVHLNFSLSESPLAFMSGNAGRQRPAIGTFDDGFEGLGPSRKLLPPNARFPLFFWRVFELLQNLVLV